MVVLPRDIEITENGTPEHDRVKLRVVLNNIHHGHNKKMVKQVVTMIFYENMHCTNPTRIFPKRSQIWC